MNMNLQLKAIRASEVLEKESKEHEIGSKSNGSTRGIREGCNEHESAIKSNKS